MNHNFLPEPKIAREHSNYQLHSLIKKESFIHQQFKKKTNSTKTAILAIAMVTLPVLSVGIVNYIWDIRSNDPQEVQVPEIDEPDWRESKFERRQHMLAMVLVGTGTTALLASTLSALWTLRLTERNSLKQAQQKREQKQKLFQEFIKYLSQSSHPEEILETTVEEAQKILECDRVLVYSLHPDNLSEIITEAVIPGRARVLGRIIKDFCLESQYLYKYNQGDFYAINNIYVDKLPFFYIKQLEKLEVQASLCTPIFSEDKLFGLLVAHQCSEPRIWQEEEKEFVNSLAKRVGFALDNAKVLAQQKSLLQQVEIETQWAKLFTQTVGYINQSLQPQDILNVGVEEVRRALNCDRTIIYSLHQDNYGIVITESVARGWVKSIGKIFPDSCFTEDCLEQYSDGLLKVFNNIYEVEISECYLEQLEKLAVKASIIAPIFHQEKLFGLLITHQCSEPRSWQKYEIDWVRQIATQVGLALDNAQVLVEQKNVLTQATIEAQWKQWYDNTLKYIHQSVQQQDILNVTVEEVRRILNCDRVLIYSLNQDHYGVIVAESIASGWTRTLGTIIEDKCFVDTYAQSYSNGNIQALDNIYEAEVTPDYLEQLEKLEVKANLVLPIFSSDRLFGLLIAHQCSEPRSWQEYEMQWLKRISTQVGFALDSTIVLRKLQAKESDKIHRALPSQIGLANRNQTNVQQDIDTVQQTLADVTKKVKQLNQSSQKILKMGDLIKRELHKSKLNSVGEQTEHEIENLAEE